MSSSKKLLLLALVMSFSASAFPQVHKWVDEDGNVHYGDVPPDDVEAERVYIESNTREPAPTANTKLLQDAEERYRRLEEGREARTTSREEEEQRSRRLDERCIYLRKQLISLQQQLPVYRDEDGKFRTVSQYDAYEGEREYLDDPMRALEIERVAVEMQIVCEKPADRGEQFVAGWDRRMEKRCEYARLRLKEAQTDERGTRQAIRDAQSEVDRYCAIDK